MAQAISTGTFCESKWVVDPTAGQGTHTTIATAITSASSGDTIFIRPGTYTENLTLKVGVNLSAYICDAFTPNVTISGTCTLTTAGTVSISGIRLQTNSAALLAVTGSAASIVNLNNCYFNCTNNTGITFSTSSGSAQINLINCSGDIGTTGIALFSHSSGGVLQFSQCLIRNSGSSTTASTASAGTLNLQYSFFQFPITTSSTSTLASRETEIDCTLINTTALTMGGSGTQTMIGGLLAGGSASALSCGSATPIISGVRILSSNTNAITGSGTITYSGLSFASTSSTINTSTQVGLVSNPGISRSSLQPAFLAYLSSSASNKTGDSTSYTLGTDALTEVFDQNGDFNTNGTFTAPITGKYLITYQWRVNGCTIAQVALSTIVTSNRSYVFNWGRTASSNDIGAAHSCLCDMDAGDTATFTLVTTGEAAATDDVVGGANVNSGVSGYLVC